MRARDITRLAVALILVALGAFAIAAFLVDVDKAVGGEFSVWERVGVLGLALLVLAPLFFYRARTGKGGVLATLQGTALWVPWIAAIASSALYLASIEGNPFWRDNALLLGSAVAGVLWLLHALVDIDYATAKRQSPGWYGLLQGEIGALRREVNGPSEPRLGGPTGEWVRRQVRGQLDQIESELRQTGLPWVTRSGFNSTWTHFHLAKSIWIEASPTPSVIALAVGDIMRLEGSDISLRPNRQADLWRAVTDIDPHLDPYVEALVSVDVQRIRSTTAPATTPTTASSIDPERRARAVIQSVHNSVNDYRGLRWAELARARWQLLQTTTIAGIFSLLVLGLALIQAVPATHLVAGWAYFLVGAVAGLFLRLHQASEEEHVADDYGLESARLNQTPLLSGMAAVIGVVLMASLAGSTLGDVLSPQNNTAQSPAPTAGAPVEASPGVAGTASPAPAASVAPEASAPVEASPGVAGTASPAPAASLVPSTTARPNPSAETSTTAELATAFDIGSYPMGLIIALIFGLTPNLVLQRLGVAASRAKRDLIATRTAQSD